MRVFINVSNIKLSGALQVAVSFINEIAHIGEHEFTIAVNDIVQKEIDGVRFGENVSIYSVDFRHPFQSGYSGYKRKIDDLVETSRAECVFSVFGPTYWTPAVPHLAGFAYGWGVNPDSEFIKSLPWYRKIKMTLENTFKGYYFRRDARYYVVETEIVRQRLSRFMSVNLDDIFVVNNTFNHFFLNPDLNKIDWRIEKRGFKLLTISSNYEHKNLIVYKRLSEFFRGNGVNDIYFIVTLPDADYLTLYGGGDPNIINVGKVSPQDCPSLYLLSDAMILPTVLESFTACYPEAMIMGKPILTSDLDFARDICRDAALYFNPFDYTDIARKILQLRKDTELQNKLVELGKKRVFDFPGADKRASEYLKICQRIVNDL